MIIKIKKRSQLEWLLLYIFTAPFAFSFLMELLHFPKAIKYTVDVAWLLILIIILLSKVKIENLRLKRLCGIAGVFYLLSLIRYVVDAQSVLYYLWGFRNNARFFVFFVACAMILKKDSIDFCMRWMDGLFWVNFVVTIWQFLVMNIRGDYLGGIFGVQKGCNAYTNIFLLIIIMWHTLRYMNFKEKFNQCLIKGMIAVLIATLSELKIFFLEFALLVTLAMTMTKFSVRKIILAIAAIIGMLLGIELIAYLFPAFANWFNLQSIFETASSEMGYTNAGDMNRLTAFAISWDRFLNTWLQKLFGLGLGNCDYASGISFLTTPFYRSYSHLHYMWFSAAFLILEMGLVGLIIYVSFFIQVYFSSRALEKEGGDVISCQMAKCMAVLSLVLFLYNSSMRMESAYMVFFVLAMPFMKEVPQGTE